MGGLTVATILTLIFVPVLYASLELSAEKRKARRVARKRAKMQRKLAAGKA
jgi:hypothetical protein